MHQSITVIPVPAMPAAAHRWKVLGVGVAANASFSAAAAGIPTTAIWLRSGYHLDNAGLGLALGAMGIGVALSELPWGMASDRWGDRPVLLGGLLSTAATLLMMALWLAPPATSLAALGLAMALLGLLGGSVNGSSGRAVMRWFGPSEQGFAMSIRQTAVPLGGGLGALMLPWLAAHHGFAWVYALLALMCGLSACFAWLWLHEPADVTPAAGAQAGQPPTPAVSPLRNRGVWRVVLGIGLLCAPQSAVLSFGSVFLHDHLHLGIAGISGTMVALQLGAMVMRVWSGRHTDRHANRPAYLRVSVLVAVLSFVLLALAVAGGAAPPRLLIALFVLAGICVSAWHGVAYTELATLAGSNSAGTALGMANTAVYLCFFLTPLLVPHLLAATSWGAVWLAAGLLALLARPLFPRPGKQ
ncbi:MFS transporter [Janthinobacterium agaricidamnosum]|uniref:Major Facilitator Superfamily protein n=1 Tax=Janthinobacterium agaricidamnosum NBRC 102515 = DSM 9628 TaxID=1349767 RepID=W0VEY7_9BURK|nr:MFS transporter [Janthinobacterium agaricidamnosum]CDG86008.1 major Facilitator Superfamily protein [Janthinobacterium agaricidamnosum NBRC 102515 = DSM 9628]